MANLSTDVHVIPQEDLLPHLQEEACPCKPVVIYERGGRIILHHAYDGREILELWMEHKESKIQ